jgi:hypothetical protein
VISAVLVALCGYLAFWDELGPERFGPPRFVVATVGETATFAVPAVQRSRAKRVAAFWVLIAAATMDEWGRVPTSPRGEEVLQALTWSGIAVMALGALAATARFVAGGPVLTLTRWGVQVSHLLGTRFVSWDALATPPPRPYLRMTEHLQVDDGASPGKRAEAGTEPGSLGGPTAADAAGKRATGGPSVVRLRPIAYYARHPEHRYAIGLDSEHERLRQALGATESAATGS